MSDDGILGDLYSYESPLTDDERKELRGIRESLQTEVRPPRGEAGPRTRSGGPELPSQPGQGCRAPTGGHPARRSLGCDLAHVRHGGRSSLPSCPPRRTTGVP